MAREKGVTVSQDKPFVPSFKLYDTDHSAVMGLPLFQVAEKEFGEKTLLGRGVTPL